MMLKSQNAHGFMEWRSHNLTNRQARWISSVTHIIVTHNLFVCLQSYTESDLATYLQGHNGKLQFAIDNGVKIGVMGYDCPDVTGCQCGNDEDQQVRQVHGNLT